MYAQTANKIHIQNLEVQPPFSKRWLMFLSGVFTITQTKTILTGR